MSFPNCPNCESDDIRLKEVKDGQYFKESDSQAEIGVFECPWCNHTFEQENETLDSWIPNRDDEELDYKMSIFLRNHNSNLCDDPGCPCKVW